MSQDEHFECLVQALCPANGKPIQSLPQLQVTLGALDLCADLVADSDLLLQRLEEGKKQGLFLKTGSVPNLDPDGDEPFGWMLNKRALHLCYQKNKRYRHLCGSAFGGYRGCEGCESTAIATFH